MKIRIRHAWALSMGLAAVAACGGRSISPTTPEMAVAPTPVAASTAAPSASAPSDPAVNPLTTLQPIAADFDGVVAERIRTGGYAYLRIDTGAASQWVATMGQGRPRGTQVHVASFGVRHDFHSNRLDRDFDTMVFGAIETPANEGDDR